MSSVNKQLENKIFLVNKRLVLNKKRISILEFNLLAQLKSNFYKHSFIYLTFSFGAGFFLGKTSRGLIIKKTAFNKLYYFFETALLNYLVL